MRKIKTEEDERQFLELHGEVVELLDAKGGVLAQAAEALRGLRCELLDLDKKLRVIEERIDRASWDSWRLWDEEQ